MVWYYIVFFFGAFPGYFIHRRAVAKSLELLVLVTGWILIVLFGVQFAASKPLIGSMASDMSAALLIAVAAAGGSVVLTYAFVVGIERRSCDRAVVVIQGEEQREVAGRAVRIWSPIGLFVSGMLFGGTTGINPANQLLNTVLFILIGAAGGLSGMEARGLRRANREFTSRSLVLFAGLPIAIIFGTLLFSALMSIFLPLTWRECMLSAAPMGWQTLGGPMVMKLHSVRLGNLTFLVNMFRDIVSLLLIPIVCRGRYRILAIAPGGVSTMDILLPVITASSGKVHLIYAMWVGACCSFWAPILVWLTSEALPWVR